MKKLLLVVVFCFMVSSVFAQEAAPSSNVTVKMMGIIIDNLCADAHKDNLSTFIKTHPKSCALMPDCAASGYAVYSNGRLFKFDKDSTVKIEEFLKKEKSSLDVVITAKKIDSGLSLISIRNQEKREIPK